MEAQDKNLKGETVRTVELPAQIFEAPINKDLMHQALVRQLANARLGTHSTKSRGEVSGGGKKPWKQKGTGRARQGSIRAPQWKGGGKPFGPTPRSYAKTMPREMRREALRAAVAAKIADGSLRVVDTVTADGKTKSLVASLTGLGVAGASTLVVTASLPATLARAARNVPWLAVETPAHVSVYQLLRAAHVVFERSALTALEAALADGGGAK
jgi:large subunit ribosomal protein L4